MTTGYQILLDLETVRDYARSLARKVSAASVERPDALERNGEFIQSTIAEIQDQIAVIESKVEKCVA